MFSQLRMREEQALLAHDYALEQAEEKDLERGRAEGLEQGLERGLERGRAEGIEQGREEGLERGKLFCLSGYGSPRTSDFRGCQPSAGYERR